MSVPFIDLKAQYATMKDSINERIQKVLDHGQFILGPEVQELEGKLAEYTGSPHVITCSNGTDAAVISMMALGIGPGDEVIVPGWSFIATAETVILAGATPVFVDIQKETYNIDPAAIENAITSKTKAIVPVGLYGLPADMDSINAIADKHGLHVIEDAAQSLGGSYKGKMSCNLSKLACTSFFPAKPLGCYGDGGAVFTNDKDLAEKLTSIRFHGMSASEKYKHVRIGTNARLDTIQAAVLLEKLVKFPWEVEQRQAVAKRYDEAFAGKIQTPTIPEDSTSVYAQYTLWTEGRDALRAGLQEEGIPTAVHYPMPMYRQEAYAEYARGAEFANCEWAAQGVVSLPMHPYMNEETQDKIIAAVLKNS